jgi:alpha-galactosidase
MLMWHYDEPVEAAALQLLNVLFSVPQISVRLGDIPPDHLGMARFWNGYWLENRELLLDGHFEAESPLANYPVVRASDGERQIVATYGGIASVDGSRGSSRIDIVNGSGSARVVLDVGRNLGDYSFRVLDALGVLVDSGEVTLAQGAHAFDVPLSGLLRLEVGAPRP